MKSGYKIEWTNHALNELSQTFIYLEENWPERELTKLATEIQKTVELISKNPELFQKMKQESNVRRAVVAKYNSLYYRKKNKVIEVLSFFSNRQHPDKMKI